MSVKQFDRTFRPTDKQVMDLTTMFSTITRDGAVVRLMSEHFGTVNGVICTDYDCSECGEDVGQHTGEFCRHQDALLEAMDEYEHERDYADEQAYAQAVSVGMG